MKTALDVLAREPVENFALNDSAHIDTNDHRFEITLSVSTKEASTKEKAKTITDFEQRSFVAYPDSPELAELFQTRLYSTNAWASGCSNDAYIGMNGVTLDFDHGITIGEAQEAFAEYNYVLHTSRTHQYAGDGMPEDRFRVILPFAPSGLYFTSGADARKVYGKMLDLYPQADKACKNPGRKFFPSTRELDTPFMLDVHVTGKYYSVDVSDKPDNVVAETATPYKWDGKLLPKSMLMKVLANCPFVKWMSEKIGDRSVKIREPLKYALITNLARFEGGREAIHEILKSDWRKHKYDPAVVDAKIENALRNGGPQKYSTIHDLGWEGEIPGWPASPAGWSHHVDLDAILVALKTQKGKVRTDALRDHFFGDFQLLSYDRKMAWICRLAQELQIDAKVLSSMAREGLLAADLQGKKLQDILKSADGLYGEPEDSGRLIYRWFTANGGLVYRDRDHRCYWVWEGSVYEIGDNQSFKSFIYSLTGMTDQGIESRKVWAVLRAESDLQGIFLNSFTWLHTDITRNIVYMHLNLANEKLVRISETNVDLVNNAANDDNVLLAPSPKMVPVSLTPLDSAGYQQAVRDIDQMILRNMACSRDNQLLYGSWALTYPLIDYVMTLPNIRCDGISESGKTRSTNLISFFVYGADHVKTATEAANYTDGASNPIVMLDNIEKANFNQGLGDFMLMVATGITKEKRQINTDRGTVQERVHCLVTTNGVENLGKTEHINRTLAIPFDRWKYKTVGWSERIFPKIAAERPRLVSAHLLLISKVLGRIAKGEMEQWQDILEKNHPGHAKNRANGFIALMGMILEELLVVIEPTSNAESVVTRWIESQNRSGRRTVADSNPIIMFLEAILEDAQGMASPLDEAHDDFQKWGYEVAVDEQTITGTAAQFHRTFAAVAKRKGMKYEYKDPKQLAQRIADTSQTLKYKIENDVVFTKKFLLSTAKDRTKTKIYKFDFDVPEDNDPDEDDAQVDEGNTCTSPAGTPA